MKENIDFSFDYTLEENGDVVYVNVENDPYKENLPDGITEEMVKKLAKYNKAFISSVESTVADIAIEKFNNNKKLNYVQMKAPFGCDTYSDITSKVIREVTKRNIKEGTEFTTPTIKTVVHWRGNKGSASVHSEIIKKLREHLK